MRQLKISVSITNRDSQSLDKYLNEISKISMISPEEEASLTRQIRNGDHAALARLTSANLRFVVSVSKKFQNQGLSLGDLINEGNVGLIKAASRFDETKGFKFISYAVWWIRQSIMQAVADQSRIVRLPANQLSMLTRLHKTFSTLQQEHEREPSVEELAEAMESTVDGIADIISKSGRHVSVDAPFSSEEENSLLDVLITTEKATDDGLMKESLALVLNEILMMIPAREREILVLSYGLGGKEPLSLADIGLKLGITRERVRQLKDRALLQLRRYNIRKKLHGYLQ